MNNYYYAHIVDEAEKLTEDWTLCSGYEEPPSTNMHYECRQARDAFRSMSNKLNHSFYGECYYVNLEGYERKRWELEFNRLYENYLDKMEAWVGDRNHIKSQIEPSLGVNLPQLNIQKSISLFNTKKLIVGLLIATGLSMILSSVFEGENTTESSPTVQTLPKNNSRQ